LKGKGDVRARDTVNSMGTHVWQFSSNALWPRLVGLWEHFRRLGRRTPKTLRLCESLPLGERRFVAVVEFEKTRFLVGGTSSSLVLLSRLGTADRRTEDDRPAAPLRIADKNLGKHQGEEKC
jgi:flagellar biogenesis protein FliO